MEHPQTPRGADYGSSARRYARALLLLPIASLLIACGGPVSSGGGSPASATAPNAATLAWDAATANNLKGYRMYYGTAPNTYLQASGQGLDVGNVTTYTIIGLSSGSRYYFAVTVFDAFNNESTYSNEVFKDIL